MTTNSSWADHKNTTVGDVTSLYDNFPFYTSLYGENPRVLVTGHQGFDDKPWTQEIRLASKNNTSYDWVAGLFYKSEQTDIAENDFYPGYLDYFNACVPIYGVGSGLAPSQCGHRRDGLHARAAAERHQRNTDHQGPGLHRQLSDQVHGPRRIRRIHLAFHFIMERDRRRAPIQANGVAEPADRTAVRWPRLHLQ